MRTRVVIDTSLHPPHARPLWGPPRRGSGVAPRGGLLVVHERAVLDAARGARRGAELDVHDDVVAAQRVHENAQALLEQVLLVRSDELELRVHYHPPPALPSGAGARGEDSAHAA